MLFFVYNVIISIYAVLIISTMCFFCNWPCSCCPGAYWNVVVAAAAVVVAVVVIAAVLENVLSFNQSMEIPSLAAISNPFVQNENGCGHQSQSDLMVYPVCYKGMFWNCAPVLKIILNLGVSQNTFSNLWILFRILTIVSQLYNKETVWCTLVAVSCVVKRSSRFSFEGQCFPTFF
jgi:hypothetical protein